MLGYCIDATQALEAAEQVVRMQRQAGRWSLWGRDAGAPSSEEVPSPLGAFGAVVMCDAMTANRGAFFPLRRISGLGPMQYKS